MGSLIRPIATIALLATVAGCTTPSGSYCQVAKPIRLSSPVVDAMSDAEVRAVLTHNTTGARLCGWAP
jgi:Zn-dependent protease with chaperone function